MLTALGRDIPSPERVEALELALGLDLSAPAEYGLTRREQEVFGMLQKVPVLHQDRAFLVLYGDRNDPPGEQLINVWISKIRAKLRPFGYGIVNVYGVGWRLVRPEVAEAERRAA